MGPRVGCGAGPLIPPHAELELGLAHHRAGRWQEAMEAYRRVLEAQPNDPDALHLLGVLAVQTGSRELGTELIGRAISLDADVALYHQNLHWARAGADAPGPEPVLECRLSGAAPRRIFVPWSLPGYRSCNGEHPLLTPLVERAIPGLEFVGPEPAPVSENALRRASSVLSGLSVELTSRFHAHPVVRPEDVQAFVASRDLHLLLATPPETDLVFHHTTPLGFGERPWILHIESVTPLFLPFLRHGQVGTTSLRHTPVFWLVRSLLEHPSCRAIFTHLEGTSRDLARIFDSAVISAKLRYVALGARLPPDAPDRIDAALERRSGTSHVEVLFTNSWHQDPMSFFLRGGAELLEAFWLARHAGAELRLVLRTALPDGLGASVLERIRTDESITVLEHPISDEELFERLCRADVFAVPGAGLHSLSVLRALHCGVVCLASDAPGYEELIEDGVTGFRVPGRRERIYSVDPDTGWLRDDYGPMFQVDHTYAAKLAAKLLELWRDPVGRVRLARCARDEARRRFAFEPWRRGVEQVLHEALGTNDSADGEVSRLPSGRARSRAQASA